MAKSGSSPKRYSPDSRDQAANLPSKEAEILKEADIDPSGDVSPDPRRGETENSGSQRGTNQPAESRENPSRSENSGSGNRDSETSPEPGHEE